MSHEAKGLSPLAGGLGVPEAWYTAVVSYGPAAAGSASGTVIRRAAATTTARGMLFLTAHLHPWNQNPVILVIWPRPCQKTDGSRTWSDLLLFAEVLSRTLTPRAGSPLLALALTDVPSGPLQHGS